MAEETTDLVVGVAMCAETVKTDRLLSCYKHGGQGKDNANVPAGANCPRLRGAIS